MFPPPHNDDLFSQQQQQQYSSPPPFIIVRGSQTQYVIFACGHSFISTAEKKSTSTSKKYYWIKKSFLKQYQTKSCDPSVMKRCSPDYVSQFLSFSHATCQRLLIFKEAVPQGTPRFSFCSECNSIVCKRKSDLSKKKHANGCTCTSLNSQVVVVYQWKGVLFDGCPTFSSSSLFESTKRKQQQQQ